MTYKFTLYDGNTELPEIYTLESNGPGAQSTPRRILDIKLGNTSFGELTVFYVADDVEDRFISGFEFDVVDGPYQGTYTVDALGSTYNASTRRTAIPVTTHPTLNDVAIIGVDIANNTWIVQGLINGEKLFYPGAGFTVSGNDAGTDGPYTVDTATNSGSYPLHAVNVGTKTWTVLGAVENFFPVGLEFIVSGSTPGAGSNPGAGVYTVVSTTPNGGNTDVVVSEVIPVGATNSGLATPTPTVTRIKVAGTIAGTAGTSGSASIPAPLHYGFSSAPSGLTGPDSNNNYQITWHLSGGTPSTKFVPGSTVVIYDNNVFTHKIMDIVSATETGGNAAVVAKFKSTTTPSSVDGTGTLLYPAPPQPFGTLQYDLDEVSSPLMLVGRGTANYNNQKTWGQAIQENQLHITENFRTTDGQAPVGPLAGQLWYDDTTSSLKVLLSKHEIVGVNTGTGVWTISGNHAADPNLQVGKTIVVYNNVGLGYTEQTFTVSTIANNGTDTDITVVESLVGASVDGELYGVDSWRPLVTTDVPLPFEGEIDMNGNKIINLADPDDATDATNKAYVDSLASGIVWLEPLQDPNVFDDSLDGPRSGTSADLSDPYAAYHRSFIVKPKQYTINGVNVGGSTWTISGNHNADIANGDTFVVDATVGSGTYTVVSATNSGANTDIVVSEAIPVGASSSGSIYHSFGAWNGLDGHVVVYDPVTLAWQSVLTNVSTNTPRAVKPGDRLGIFMVPDNDDPLSTLPGGHFVGEAGKIYIVDTVSTPDYTITYLPPVEALEPDAVSVVGTNSVHFGKSYTFRGNWPGTFMTDYKWIQFAGPSMIVDGVGLVYTGNILNLDETYTDTLYNFTNGTGLNLAGLSFSLDETYTDTLYKYTNGTGLNLNALSFSLDETYTDTLYNFTNGTGLNLTGLSFSLDETYTDTLYKYTNGTGIDLAGLSFSLDTTYTDTLYNFTNGTGLNLAGLSFSLDETYTDTLYADITHTHVLNDLSNVVINSPTLGEVLKYDGTNWINDIDDAGTGASEPATQIVYGTGTGIASSTAFTFDSTTGALTFNGGSVAAPGDISITSAAATSGSGGDITIQAADSVTSGTGADINITAGAGGGGSFGGSVNITSGDGDASAPGGNVTINVGNGPINSGDFEIYMAGAIQPFFKISGNTGEWYLYDGAGSTSQGNPGDVLTSGGFGDRAKWQSPAIVAINNQSGTTYQLLASDTGQVVRANNASPITITVPADVNPFVDFQLGATLAVRQVGDGVVTIAPAGGVTINVPTGFTLSIARKHGTIALHKVGTDEWDVTGDLAEV